MGLTKDNPQLTRAGSNTFCSTPKGNLYISLFEFPLVHFYGLPRVLRTSGSHEITFDLSSISELKLEDRKTARLNRK
uniref:Uncharacterized protein n=1 Tax=Rhizoctonia solani TaxID=456999 RepID=N0A372_9AGAM|nr:hypothetical protein RSOL_m00840 [Rhizoctonia solani]AGK45408.1 hypothetical protein RSOL_m00840 [Rhizoctonia solani]